MSIGATYCLLQKIYSILVTLPGRWQQMYAPVYTLVQKYDWSKERRITIPNLASYKVRCRSRLHKVNIKNLRLVPTILALNVA